MPHVFDTLTHFVTHDRAHTDEPLSIDGYFSYVSTWNNPDVRTINLLTGACPKYSTTRNTIFLPCVWELRDGSITETAYEIDNGVAVRTPVRPDCYGEVNRILIKSAAEYQARFPEYRFYYSPLIHPRRTTVSDLEQLLADADDRLLALKMHGLASASGPDDVTPELATSIASLGIPLILHTDYNTSHTCDVSTTGGALASLQRANSPRAWIDFCTTYDIRASLQHGARNDGSVFAIVRSAAGQFTVGLGPRIDGRGPRIVEATDNYVASVLDGAGVEHVLFCSDYPFNRAGEDLTQDLQVLAAHERAAVFHRNAEVFFNVPSPSTAA